MKRLASLLAAVILASASVTSCLKADCLFYGDQSFCDVVAGQLITDEGNIYNVVKGSADDEWTTWDRAFVYCNLIRKTAQGAENEYDIEVLSMSKVLSKDPILVSTMDESVTGKDPIHFEKGFVTGVDKLKMNILFVISFLQNSEKSHLINIAYDDVKSNTDTVYFQLRHNGYGEFFGAENINNDLAAIGQGWLSFPLEDYLPAGQDKVVVNFSSEWYKTDPGTGYLVTDVQKEEISASINIPKRD